MITLIIRILATLGMVNLGLALLVSSQDWDSGAKLTFFISFILALLGIWWR